MAGRQRSDAGCPRAEGRKRRSWFWMRTSISIKPMGKRSRPWIRSFTLIELMVVLAVIGILAGLLLAAAGGVRNQAARNQAKSEIAALETALGRFQLDNGSYPHSTSANPTLSQATTSYAGGSTTLFTNLMRRTILSNAPTAGLPSYLEPRANMVATNTSPNYFQDPWGYGYGYYWDTNSASSLFSKSTPDIWSTGGQSGTGTQTNRARWITSWD